MAIQQVRSPGGATEVKQDAIIAALESVGLDAATLAALESITATVSNFPDDYPDSTASVLLTAIQDAVQGTLNVDVISSLSASVSGVVGLDAPTLAALETINAVVSGEVELGSTTLAALESVTATVSNFPVDYPDSAAAVLLNDIKTAIEGVVAVSGTVALDSATLSALETINTVVQNWPSEFPLPAAQVSTLTPQTDALTDAELRASPIEVDDGHVQSLTDAQLRATPVPVDITNESIEISNDVGNPIPVAGTVSVQEPITVDGVQLDALTDSELRASDVDVADSGEREYTHVVATVTDAGDTTIYTPSGGTSVRIRWIYAINNPSANSSPLIKVSLGSTEIYRVWALSKRQLVTGAVDDPLIVNLSESGQVAVTVLLEEV